MLRICEKHLEGDISEPALKAADRTNVESHLSLFVTEVHPAEHAGLSRSLLLGDLKELSSSGYT